MVTKEKLPAFLTIRSTSKHTRSLDARNREIWCHRYAAQFDPKFTGFSFYHPAHDDDHDYHVLMPVYFNLQQERFECNLSCCKFLFPHSSTYSKKEHLHWIRCHPNQFKILAKFFSQCLTFRHPQVLLQITKTQFVVIWNHEGQQTLSQNNRDKAASGAETFTLADQFWSDSFGAAVGPHLLW